ncbi:MAG: hypothetical protein JXQ99_05775 [Hyphomicrobiaceae bacterium]
MLTVIGVLAFQPAGALAFSADEVLNKMKSVARGAYLAGIVDGLSNLSRTHMRAEKALPNISADRHAGSEPQQTGVLVLRQSEGDAWGCTGRGFRNRLESYFSPLVV